MKITSKAFGNNQIIPVKYTCDGDNVNPPLVFEDTPEGTVTLALIMDDPDAPKGTFTHWLLWDMELDTAELNENAVLPGITKGRNSAGQDGYIGPCPPSGEHRYFFKLYALDIRLNLPEGSSRKEMEAAMAGHIIGEAELMGRYARIK